jgi:hypothetical protein
MELYKLLGLIIVILFFRLILFRQDNALFEKGNKKLNAENFILILVKTIAEISICIFWLKQCWWLALGILVVNLLILLEFISRLQKKSQLILCLRILTLFLYIPLIYFSIYQHYLWVPTPIDKILIIIIGGLAVMNEPNSIILLILNHFNILPCNKEDNKPDIKELQTGKLIGVLERILVLIFIISNHIIAIGFVITAKAVYYNYRNIKKRGIAEYAMIGTFLSFVIAIIIGYMIKTAVEILPAS